MTEKKTGRSASIAQSLAARLRSEPVADDPPAVTTPPVPPVETPALPARSAPRPQIAADELAAVRDHFVGDLGRITQGRRIERIAVRRIAPNAQPDQRQPRELPLPEEFTRDGGVSAIYRQLYAELLILGESLAQQQLQPIIVYPAPADTPVSYYLLVGHRRWTAAYLTGIEALDAYIIEVPSPRDRITLQYAENEQRAQFSDMERCWALLAMKDYMGDANPWSAVEQALHISEPRRKQLTRMAALSPGAQRMCALLRVRETALRPLHEAVRAKTLTLAQADVVIDTVVRSALESDDGEEIVIGGRQIEGEVAAILNPPPPAHMHDDPTGGGVRDIPTWVSPLRTNIVRVTQGLMRAVTRPETLPYAERELVVGELDQLLEQVEVFRQRLQR